MVELVMKVLSQQRLDNYAVVLWFVKESNIDSLLKLTRLMLIYSTHTVPPTTFKLLDLCHMCLSFTFCLAFCNARV